MPLAPNPTAIATETILQQILRFVLGSVIFIEILGNPSSAGGKSEIAFENANKRDIKQFQETVRRYQTKCGKILTQDEKRRLHDAITKQGLTIDEIAEYAESLFGCPAPR